MTVLYTSDDFKIGDKVSYTLDENIFGLVTGICFRSDSDFLLLVTFLNGNLTSEQWLRPFEIKKIRTKKANNGS